MLRRRNIFIVIFIGLLLAVFAVYLLADNPPSFLKWAFKAKSDTPERVRIAGFEEMADKVIVKRNVIYSREYKKSEMDIYVPKDNFGTPKPTIFWAHGGAFIAGDKKTVADYCTMLASQGYVVVNMNYSLAPEYEYPTPVVQIGDAYLYMISNHERFDVDPEQIAFGGDSAGGQIIGQFVNVQVNKEYANDLEVKPVVNDPESIKAVIFYSALLDVNKFDENESEYANHVFDKSAQAYFGLKEWKNSELVNQANIVGNVNGSYPPVYITDGNTASFQSQAEELASQLKEHDVPVTTTFFPKEQAELRHQYQFKFEHKEAVTNYEAVTQFLHENLMKEK